MYTLARRKDAEHIVAQLEEEGSAAKRKLCTPHYSLRSTRKQVPSLFYLFLEFPGKRHRHCIGSADSNDFAVETFHS